MDAGDSIVVSTGPDKLPYSIRIFLESTIRNCDNFQVTKEDVKKIIDLKRGMGRVLSFHSYVKKDITKVLEQERIDTEVNKRVSEINETYEARIRALEERLASLPRSERASGNSSQKVHFTSKEHSPLE
ncbi:unnamed protein product [Cuscuta campestris]|uniref:Uncharacterized protein n=1 Tax=Cuscuta campestris TaxID=132261 RepID=A0A484N8P4_9ASTE|nr:unnamed protein product [Cuscuta campestris]